MSPELLGVFFLSAAVLAMAPGPDNIFVLTQSLLCGSRCGLLVVLGLCTGLVFHTSLVALGLAALLKTSAQTLLLIKLCGAGYLVYLAFQSWQVTGTPGSVQAELRPDAWKLYRRGVIMNVSNPKVALFFLAFLPQFVKQEYGPVGVQILVLGLLFMLSTVLVFGAIALLAGRYSERMNNSVQRSRLLSRVAAVIFLALAFHLLWDSW
jgi:threonine/homoserine/homoserine lactone efflux protein